MSEALIKEFLINKSNSPDNSIYDEKHKKIIKNVNIEADLSKFRNWDLQNDMGLRYKIGYIPKLFLNYYKLKLLHPFINLINKRINHYFEFSTKVDDIKIIQNNGGKKLLGENPQNNTPGAINYPRIMGYSVSTRWLRYIYFLSQINKHKLLLDDSIWLDLGSYYGGLQGLVKKYYPNISIIMIDIFG